MGSISTAVPPLPPEVAQQQQPAPVMFRPNAVGSMDSASQAVGDSSRPATEAKQLLEGIGQGIQQLVTVIGVTRPALLPLLKISINALGTVAKELETQEGTAGAPPALDPQSPGVTPSRMPVEGVG